MLKSSNRVIGEGREASKLDVPSPNFITQGVSLRQDVAYGILWKAPLKFVSGPLLKSSAKISICRSLTKFQ
jgi:hypothetical protein